MCWLPTETIVALDVALIVKYFSGIVSIVKPDVKLHYKSREVLGFLPKLMLCASLRPECVECLKCVDWLKKQIMTFDT